MLPRDHKEPDLCQYSVHPDFTIESAGGIGIARGLVFACDSSLSKILLIATCHEAEELARANLLGAFRSEVRLWPYCTMSL